jgi:dCMP deaminase
VRPDIDKTLMRIATVWQDRSTCDRNHVGAVISREGRTLGSGYNGAPAGMPHCEHQVTFLRGKTLTFNVAESVSMVEGEPCRLAIHAESNAIAYAARNGVSIVGGTIYTTLSPCFACSLLIIAAGLTRVVYDREYRDTSGIQLMTSAGLIVDQLGPQ